MASTARLRDVPAQMLATGEIAAAARRLAKSLGNPRQHSVWVRSELDEERFETLSQWSDAEGKYVNLEKRPIPRTITPVICVALHPRFGKGVSVPVTWEGYAVREVEWG